VPYLIRRAKENAAVAQVRSFAVEPSTDLCTLCCAGLCQREERRAQGAVGAAEDINKCRASTLIGAVGVAVQREPVHESEAVGAARKRVHGAARGLLLDALPQPLRAWRGVVVAHHGHVARPEHAGNGAKVCARESESVLGARSHDGPPVPSPK